MAFKMSGFNPGKGTGLGNEYSARKIRKAKKKILKAGEKSGPGFLDESTGEWVFDGSNFGRKGRKAAKKLKKAGYTDEQIEEATGAEGWARAMDWASDPAVREKEKVDRATFKDAPTYKREEKYKSPLEKGGRRTKKTVKTKQAIEDAMYSEDDVINEPTKYSDQDKKEGAGSSTEFYQIEGGDTKTKKKYRIGLSDRKIDGSLRTYKTGKKKDQAGKKVLAILSEDVVKTDRKGKTKKTKYKDTAKKSLFGKKRSIQLDSYAKQEAEAKKTGVDPSEITDFGETKFTGEYKKPLKEKDKKRKRKATLTTRGKNAGKIEEKIKRWHGIGYRKTGRVIEDQAFKDKRS